MATLHSKLILSLSNRVSEPARRVQADLRRVNKTARAMAGSIGRTVRNVGLAAAGVGTALFGLANSTANTGDRVAKAARKFGLTAEAYQELEFAAERSGIAQSQFESNMTAFTKRMGEAAQGSGPALDALAALGLKIDNIKALAPEDQMKLIADRLKGIENPAERAAIMSDLFSRSGVAMVNMLGDGSKSIEELMQRARDLGLVMSQDAAEGSEAFKDAQLDAQLAIRGLKQTFGTEFMPVFTDVMVRIANWMAENQERIKRFAVASAERLRSMLPAAVEMARGLGDVAGAIGKVATRAAEVVGGKRNLGILIGAMLTSGTIFRVASFAVAAGRLGASLGRMAAGMSLIGGASGFLRNSVGQALALNSALARMEGRKPGRIQKLGVAVKALAGGVGLGAVASGLGKVGAVVAGISAPVWFAVAAAVAAVGAAWKYWDRIKAIVSGVASAISEELQPVMDWIKEKLEPLKPIIEPIGKAFTVLGEGISAAFSAIRNFFTGDLFTREKLGEKEFSSIEAKAKAVAKTIIDSVKGAFNDFIDWIAGIPGRIIDAIGTIDLSNIINWPSMPAWLKGFVDSRAGARARDRPNGPGPVDGTRARGGPVSAGRRYLVGERGAEMFTPRRSGYVHTARQTARMMSRAAAIASASAIPAAASIPAAPSPIASQAQVSSSGQPGGRSVSVTFGDIVIPGGANASAEHLGQEFGRQVSALMRSQFSDEF